jgi:hypothetical protein
MVTGSPHPEFEAIKEEAQKDLGAYWNFKDHSTERLPTKR